MRPADALQALVAADELTKARMDISAIEGEELKAVEFVEDYLQLRFGDPLLKLYDWPYVMLTDFSVGVRRAGVSQCAVRADRRDGEDGNAGRG